MSDADRIRLNRKSLPQPGARRRRRSRLCGRAGDVRAGGQAGLGDGDGKSECFELADVAACFLGRGWKRSWPMADGREEALLNQKHVLAGFPDMRRSACQPGPCNGKRAKAMPIRLKRCLITAYRRGSAQPDRRAGTRLIAVIGVLRRRAGGRAGGDFPYPQARRRGLGHPRRPAAPWPEPGRLPAD